MLKKIIKKARGFTLIELVIVIVIIGILSVVSVPIYRGYVRRAMSVEAEQLLGAVAKAQKAYWAETSTYLTVASASSNSVLDIDAGKNKYFTAFAVATSGVGSAATFTATTAGAVTGDASGISVTLAQPASGTPTITKSGMSGLN